MAQHIFGDNERQTKEEIYKVYKEKHTFFDDLSYCRNNKVVFSRLRSLYEKRTQDIICVKMHVPNNILKNFADTHQEGFCNYPDVNERARFWDAYLKEHELVEDDSIPSAPLKEMDQGLCGGLFGADVRFLCDPKTGHISSMAFPLMKDLSELDSLDFNIDNPWYKRYIKQIDTFVSSSSGKYGISHLITVTGLNFIFELLGATASYMAVEEKPLLVRKAFQLGHKVNLCVQKTFFEKIPLLGGGTCSNFAQWLPGKIISESIDPFHMTSVDYFEKWGRGPVELLFAEFDGGIVHIHGNGRHLLESASTLKGLKAIFLGDDKGFQPAFEILEDAKNKTNNIPLICFVGFNIFEQALKNHNLAGGVFYNVTDVPDIYTANKYMELVYKY